MRRIAASSCKPSSPSASASRVTSTPARVLRFGRSSPSVGTTYVCDELDANVRFSKAVGAVGDDSRSTTFACSTLARRISFVGPTRPGSPRPVEAWIRCRRRLPRRLPRRPRWASRRASPSAAPPASLRDFALRNLRQSHRRASSYPPRRRTASTLSPLSWRFRRRPALGTPSSSTGWFPPSARVVAAVAHPGAPAPRPMAAGAGNSAAVRTAAC